MDASGTANGPSLVGVGAASVDFQVGTGRMPMAMQGPQAQQKPEQFNEEQTAQMAAYVASASVPVLPYRKSSTWKPPATPLQAASCSASTAPCATTQPAQAAP